MATIGEAGEAELAGAVDAESAAEPEFRWERSHTFALVVLCLALLLDTVDITIVNVALPTLQRDLHFSQAGLSWVVNAYVVLFGGFLLLGGRTGDVVGRKKVFLAGTAVFTAASLAAGLAQNSTTLVVARGAQGIAGAFIAAMTLAILVTTFPEGKARTKAMAIWGTTAGFAGALGVLGGGLLMSGPGWRWIFLINLPVCAFILIAAVKYLLPDGPGGHHRSFDIIGAITVTGGVTLLAYGFVQTDTHDWGSGRTLGLLGGAAVILIYFVAHELYVTKEPLFSFSLLRNKAVAGANAVQALFATSMWLLFFFFTLFEQQVLGYSALKTGLSYLPFTLVIVLAAGFGPKLLPYLGTRVVVIAGSLIAAVGLWMFSRISEDSGLWAGLILPSVIYSFGFSILYIPINVAAVSGVPAEQTGVASALLNVSRQVLGAIGFAIVASIATDRTNNKLAAGHKAGDALVSGFRLGFGIAAAVVVAAAVAALLLFREDGRAPRGAKAGAGAPQENATV